MPSLPVSAGGDPDPYNEYATFLHPGFDPNSFAHSIVNNEPYPPVDPSNPTKGGTAAHAIHGKAVANALEEQRSQGGAKVPVPPSGTISSAAPQGFMRGLQGGIGGGDVSAALARLNFGVEDLNRQLKAEVTKHHSSLLLSAASLGGLENDLNEVRNGLSEVEGGVVRLRTKITEPHSQLSGCLTLSTRLQRATSLVRRAHRFTVLARRLEGQMAEMNTFEGSKVEDHAKPNGTLNVIVVDGKRNRRERAMAEAALTLAEIGVSLRSIARDLLTELLQRRTIVETLLVTNEEASSTGDDAGAMISIRSIASVEANVSEVLQSRERVVEEMESMIHSGLTSMDPPLLASSLQTAHNLSVLPVLINNLVTELTDTVVKKIRACFDMVSLAREINGKDNAANASSAFVYKSRARNEPTAVTLPQWTSILWARLEALLADLGLICIKANMLEKVLKLKKDQFTQISFLDEAMSVLENQPSSLFWTSLSQALEAKARESTKSSTFVQQTLSSGYTRLLRLFHEFFTRIAVHTDTTYSQNQQSPETILVLRSILPFENLYLNRSTNRLNESVSSSYSITSSLSSSFSGRPPSVPTANEGQSVARAIVNELDAARFDPLLVKAVARGAKRAIELYVQRAETLIAHDHSATSLLGPLATPSQHSNANLASSLYHLWSPLVRWMKEHTDPVKEIMSPALELIRRTYLSIANPVILATRRDFSSIITRMHRVDYSKQKPDANSSSSSSGTSSYMTDLMEKLTLVREEILGAYRVGDLGREWALDLAKFTVQTYIIHASIVKPLGEVGKLKLTADTTSLEFGISQYLSSHSLTLASMGDQFRALRAFRPLLFLETHLLSSAQHTVGVPTLILLHHIVSRSPSLSLPHTLQGWTEGEYVRWLNEHGEAERREGLEQVLENYEQSRRTQEKEDQRDDNEEMEVKALKDVLARTSSA